ncbi:hypothetical protein RO3G_01670 [Rhizopus delemar RA 99-880]|uniref:Uncharacterized protein n=3 Tax=Rhizopus TaxID=4842 RepID=I1BL86_RHIO9|nr:hypothetical protein RO3G_01670 [Rhizopus delemar RA 99-880]|eukprot:EIE76966.1 hypothetical protein RO3G_01670 [Rhizopus delemar RA 99-880]
MTPTRSHSPMSFGSSGLPNIEQDMEPFQLPVSRPSEADIHDSPRNLRRRIARESSSDITDPPAIQLAKAKASYRPDVSESDILRDLIFIFQGIDGQYIKLNPTTDEYLIDKQLLCVSEPTEQLIYRLTETGWLYTHIKSFIEENMNLNRSGLVGQSLCAAIQDELTDYYKLIAILEAQVEKQLAQKSRVISDQSLTLKRLLVWMEDANNKLRLMSMLVDASQGHKGGALVSALHNHTKHGDPFIRQFITNILQTISKPFYHMLQRWVYEGELDDPHKEFFVACDLTVPEENLWQHKYSIREDMLPSFLSKELAQKVFSIGKSLNFIRYSCHERVDPYDVIHRTKDIFKYGETLAVERAIDVIYLDTSQSLLNLLKTKYKLMDHLRALKRYLLLGQGDFIQCLMDVLGLQLNKPANTLYRHNLTSLLETTIRSSNAQYDQPEILRRLDVRLLEIQKDDLGWDVFTLDYHVDTPINTVINPHAMVQYLQIFNFLWRLKRMEYTLSASWRQCGKSNREFSQLSNLTQDLHQAQMTIQRMIHFIYQLQHYVLFEVLECSWKKLENDIEKCSIDLDSIIKAHTNYLREITEKGFLSGLKEKALAERLDDLFSCILNYKAVLDHLHGYASSELVKRHSQHALEDNQERLEKIRRHHQEIEGAFTTQVLQFLDILKSYHDEDLRSLSIRLDYNDFYSSTSS